MTTFLKTLLILGLTVVDCLSAFFNLTALMGYACKKSTFLLPNLFMQMFNLIIGLLVLSGLCVLSGFVHLLSCAVLSGLTLIIGGWMIYYWIVLFKAYQRVSKSLFGVYQDSDDDSFFEMTPDMTYRFWNILMLYLSKILKFRKVRWKIFT